MLEPPNEILGSDFEIMGIQIVIGSGEGSRPTSEFLAKLLDPNISFGRILPKVLDRRAATELRY